MHTNNKNNLKLARIIFLSVFPAILKKKSSQIKTEALMQPSGNNRRQANTAAPQLNIPNININGIQQLLAGIPELQQLINLNQLFG